MGLFPGKKSLLRLEDCPRHTSYYDWKQKYGKRSGAWIDQAALESHFLSLVATPGNTATKTQSINVIWQT
jgi:hypothetical protein